MREFEKHDYINNTTSGKYKIIYINTPEEMKHAHNIIDRNQETKYIQLRRKIYESIRKKDFIIPFWSNRA